MFLPDEMSEVCGIQCTVCVKDCHGYVQCKGGPSVYQRLNQLLLLLFVVFNTIQPQPEARRQFHNFERNPDTYHEKEMLPSSIKVGLPTDSNMETPEAAVRYCSQLKDEGNALFQSANYRDAEAVYSFVLHVLDEFCPPPTSNVSPSTTMQEVRQLVEVTLSNRAQCSLNQGNFDEAMQSCEELLRMNPAHPKGLYRKGMAAARIGGAPMRKVAEECANRLDALVLPSEDPKKDYHEEAAKLRELIQQIDIIKDKANPKSEDEVVCVLLTPGAHPARLKEIKLSASDPRLQRGSTLSFPCPTLHSFGLPFCISPVRFVPGDNQFATYLMKERTSGFAPMGWQADVGEVILFRDDRVRTSVAHAWALWDFMCTLVDVYGDQDPDAVTEFLTKENFENFMKLRKQSHLQWW